MRGERLFKSPRLHRAEFFNMGGKFCPNGFVAVTQANHFRRQSACVAPRVDVPQRVYGPVRRQRSLDIQPMLLANIAVEGDQQIFRRFEIIVDKRCLHPRFRSNAWDTEGGIALYLQDALGRLQDEHARLVRRKPAPCWLIFLHQRHASPKARGQAAKLCHMGHVLMENRNGLVVDAILTHATGTAEREAALTMLGCLEGRHRITPGADKNNDTVAFVAALREMDVTPHVAQNNTNRRSAIDGRTTRHPGYGLSQKIRKRIEEVFGWAKTCGNMRKTRHRGQDRVEWSFTLTAAVYNLIRLPKLLACA